MILIRKTYNAFFWNKYTFDKFVVAMTVGDETEYSHGKVSGAA